MNALKTFYKENKILTLTVGGILVFIVVIMVLGSQNKAVTTAVQSEPVAETLGQLPPAPASPNAILQSTPSAVADFIDPTKTQLPATARIYKFSQTSTLSLSAVDSLAVKLGFKNKPKDMGAGRYNYDEGDNFLHYDSTQDGVVFGLGSYAATPSAAINFSKADVVSGLLTSLNLKFPDLIVDNSNPVVVAEDQAVFLVPRQVNNLDVVSLPFDPALVSFDFDSQNRLVGGVFYYHLLQSGEGSFGVYPLKTLDEAVKALSSGQGTLGELGLDGYEAADITGITSLSTDAVKLVYRDRREHQQFLRPAYAFSGTVSLRDGRTTSATYFLDATK